MRNDNVIVALLLSIPLVERLAVIVAHPGAVQGVDSWFLLADAARGGGPATAEWPLPLAIVRSLYTMSGTPSWIMGMLLDYSALLAVYTVLRLSGLSGPSAALIVSAAGSVPGAVVFGVQLARENIARPTVYLLPAYTLPAALIASLAGLIHHLLAASVGSSTAVSGLLARVRGEVERVSPAIGGGLAALLAFTWTVSLHTGSVSRIVAYNIGVSRLAALGVAGLALGIVVALMDPGDGLARRVMATLAGTAAGVAAFIKLVHMGVGMAEAVAFSAPAVLAAVALGPRPRGPRSLYAWASYLLLGLLAASFTLPTDYTLGAIGRLSSVLIVFVIAGFSNPNKIHSKVSLLLIIISGITVSTLLATDNTILNSNITYDNYDVGPARYLSSVGWRGTVIVDYTGSGPAYYYGLNHKVSCKSDDYTSGNLVIVLNDMVRVGCRLIGGRIYNITLPDNSMIVYSNGYSTIVVAPIGGSGG